MTKPLKTPFYCHYAGSLNRFPDVILFVFCRVFPQWEHRKQRRIKHRKQCRIKHQKECRTHLPNLVGHSGNAGNVKTEIWKKWNRNRNQNRNQNKFFDTKSQSISRVLENKKSTKTEKKFARNRFGVSKFFELTNAQNFIIDEFVFLIV